MARSQLRFVIRDLAGNVIQNARANVYLVGTVTPVTDLWTAKTGGTNVSSLVSDGDGEIEGWLDAPKQLDVVVTDNGHAAYYPASPSTTLTFADLPTQSIEAAPPSDTILTAALLGVPNGIATLDGNGAVIGAASAGDISTLQGEYDALAARVAVLEAGGGGGGGGGGTSQVVPMGIYSGSSSLWNRSIALVGDARWNIPITRWFSSGMDDNLVTAKSDIDDVNRTVILNMPAKIGGVIQRWSDVVAGNFDTQITAWFTAIGTWAATSVYVSFVDEPDGANNAFSESTATYFAAFDHVKAIAAAHAPLVKLGTTMAVASRMPNWVHNAYDWLGWDPYNRASTGVGWLSFAGILQRDYAFMAAPGKPLIMTCGCVENSNDAAGPNSKKQWYINAGNTMLTFAQQYPLIQIVVMWDSADATGDFHIDTSANALAGFKALVAADYTQAAGGSNITVDNIFTPGVSAASGNVVAMTAPAVVATGKFVIVVVRGNGNPATCSVTDNVGNTYAQDLFVQNTGAAKSFLGIYSTKVAFAMNTATIITATLGASVTNKDIAGIVARGLNATTWKDQTASATGSSSTVDSGATPTTAGAGMIFGGAILALPLALDSLDDGNGHAMNIVDDQQLTGTNNRGVSCGYALVPGAEQAHYVANPHGNSGSWAAGVVAYKT